MAEYIEREAAMNAVLVSDIDKDFPRMDIAARLHDISAADVRPVVKARWTDHRTIEHDGEWYCTACGKEITIYMGEDRPDRYRFCPNCGAKMEES